VKPVRTRFAPSPTGYLHVGGVRTALFAWLIARQSKGQFILRLEDTDKEREVVGSDNHIMESLKWLGLDWDEGPDETGGLYGPYRQSQRLDIYKEWAERLVSSNRAYADPYSSQQVQTFRDEAKAAKKPFLYRNHRPLDPPVWDGKQALRFKSDPKAYKWHDEVLGDLSTGPEVIDDFILIKSDSYPTYNFAHIVDDCLMQISHVIRSQEFIASIPNYLNLYEALSIERPLLATLPYVMGPDGKKKLSKRDGAKDILDYRQVGYIREALLSFLATLGWNDGTTQEIYSINELIAKFQLSRVQRGGAKFDEQRLNWVDGFLIRHLPLDDLYERCQPFWPNSVKTSTEDYKKRVLALIQERLKYLSELPELTNFFFQDLPVDPELISKHKLLSKLSDDELKSMLSSCHETLAESDFSVGDLEQRLNKLLESLNQKPVVLFSLIRIATTQVPASPALADTLAVIGKDRSLSRIDNMLSSLSHS
jgi:glutamyl-tRNA synthetase